MQLVDDAVDSRVEESIEGRLVHLVEGDRARDWDSFAVRERRPVEVPGADGDDVTEGVERWILLGCRRLLVDLEAEFWRCVQEDKPWPGYAAPVAPVAPTEFREVDLTGSNEWAASAADWLENKAAANTFKKAVEDIKKLVEPDVGRAHGHGIEAKRSKAGAITIKELKA